MNYEVGRFRVCDIQTGLQKENIAINSLTIVVRLEEDGFNIKKHARICFLHSRRYTFIRENATVCIY